MLILVITSVSWKIHQEKSLLLPKSTLKVSILRKSPPLVSIPMANLMSHTAYLFKEDLRSMLVCSCVWIGLFIVYCKLTSNVCALCFMSNNSKLVHTCTCMCRTQKLMVCFDLCDSYNKIVGRWCNKFTCFKLSTSMYACIEYQELQYLHNIL